MFSRNLIFVVSFLIFLISCEKDDPVEQSNECVEIINHHLRTGEIHYWEKTYFTNDKIVRKEYSYGDEAKYEYDGYGNLTRSEYFSNNYQKYTIELYSDNKIQFSYVINSTNDTIDWEKYNYENSVLVHSETMDCNRYYYYGDEMDSVITYYKNELLYERLHKKTENNNLVYQARYRYDSSEELDYYFIDHYEFTENNLTREVHEHWNLGFDDIYTYEEYKYYYESGLLIKREKYYDPDVLNIYFLYHYENDNLVKIELFDYNDNLLSYDMIGNSCY